MAPKESDSSTWAVWFIGLGVAVLLPIVSIYVPELSREIVVGIDLGTTYSVVSVCVGGHIEVVPQDDGSKILPSFVSFPTSSKVLVGSEAKNLSRALPKDTLFDIKRIIGRKWSDPVVQEEIKTFPFEVYPSDSAEPWPMIRVRKGDAKPKQFTPQEISALVIKTLKQRLENYLWIRKLLGWKLGSATISVPANFDLDQRRATIMAGNMAGLRVVQLITEPAAAALAYRLAQKPGTDYVIVFDLGGGTLDVALLLLDKDIFQVISTTGHPHLGGEDFDRALAVRFSHQLVKENPQLFPRGEEDLHLETLDQLKRAAEDIKITLSTEHTITSTIALTIPSSSSPSSSSSSPPKQISLTITLTRAEFEKMNEELFGRMIKPVHEVLENTGITKEQVDAVVLVGGSSRIPKVREDLAEFFGEEKLNTDINPDEAISRGAALTQACRR